MLALRNRPIAAFSGPFWLSALCAAFAPTSVGYQDLSAFLARQPGVSERWRDHLIASPFGTIHAATFSFARPIGTEMSEPIGAQSVNFDPRALDVKVWSGHEPSLARPALQLEYPTVNRRLKGDRMPLPQSSPSSSGSEGPPPLQPVDAPAMQPMRPASPPQPAVGPRPKNAEQFGSGSALAELEAPIEAFGTLPSAGALEQDDLSSNSHPALTVCLVACPDAKPGSTFAGHALSVAMTNSVPAIARPDERGDAREEDGEDDAAIVDKPPEIPVRGESGQIEAAPSPFASLSFLDEDMAERNAQLYFGGGVMGSRSGLQQWPLGAEPVLVSPSVDPDIKLSVLEGPPDAGPGGETVAGKDNVGQFKSPAERLSLAGKPRAKAEKCLADAVYFEARGEPLRGQMAVAQVVMNRVFSGFYPNNVCGVVYQNADRHLACQFTFACEGKDLSRIDELDMWEQAKRIAKDTLDGKIWLTEVGHATHYHAYWVHPSWVHEMKKMYQLGVHTFYRPRAWGDGSDAPIWGATPVPPQPAGPTAENPAAVKTPAAAAKSPEPTAKVPAAAASPAADAAGNPRTAKL
jgi:Cell Wall Hydrolase